MFTSVNAFPIDRMNLFSDSYTAGFLFAASEFSTNSTLLPFIPKLQNNIAHTHSYYTHSDADHQLFSQMRDSYLFHIKQSNTC